MIKVNVAVSDQVLVDKIVIIRGQKVCSTEIWPSYTE